MQWYNGLSSLIFIYIQAHYTIQEKKMIDLGQFIIRPN